MKLFLKFILALTVFVSACTQDKSDPPSIVNLNLVQDSILKEDGAILQLTYAISDDNGLDKFRITILDDFPDARFALAPWFFEEDYDVSGTNLSDTVTINLPYPDLEVGQYKITFTVADIDQNERSIDKSFFIY
jgi:hypothetical protein